MKKIAYSVMLLCSYYSFSQVGIGTTTPSSELEIETTNTGIPALELNPQSAPTGSVTGQLAVIGDKLFMYDATRVKWLSTETTALQYGYENSADDQVIWFGGDVGNNSATDTASGAKMPFDGTIVYMTIESSGGNASKSFEIEINGTAVPNNADPTLDGRFNLSGGSFTRTTFNIDFNAGDYIMLRARSNGSGVIDPAAIIWVKWRE
ncbi:hypothetical protein [Flavivirga spongiicola]|uniref:Uncharacterized protein n=1 Tax=Flavivirga spongiicola TaxID=421621 RepID=A0ABU7XQ86_9FLAO|nr:hypothetical protein [Flavivirga sp. MEBiC05379]MDO5977947.1 hypothetical protein [Flavivirga sp. MEBiC05379]